MTRREALLGLALGGAAAFRQRSGGAGRAPQPATPVRFDVPQNACDCHIHIIDPQRFPFAAERVYTPEPASVEESRACHRALRLARTVVVQASFYGTDNRCMLDAVRQLGANGRGVAVIDDRTTDAELEAMDRAGVRGIRVNLETVGQTDPEVGRRRFQAAVARVANRRWHIQVYTRPTVIERIQDLVQASPGPVVFDHFGGAQAALGPQQPGFDALVGLVRSGKAYVKISGANRASTQAPDFPDVAPLAKALLAANLDRIVWGTDWPHVNSTPSRGSAEIAAHLAIDDGRVMNQLAVWAPDAAQRQRILVENPARLYGF